MDWRSTRSISDMFPFNQDLNRLTLIVKGIKTKTAKITWGKTGKTFKREDLEKGINLADAVHSNTCLTQCMNAIEFWAF